MQELPLIARAREHRDRTAIRSGDRQEHRYSDLLAASALLASVLLSGAADLQEARIAFMAPAGFAYVVMQWAIWRAGGIAIPLALSATRPEIEYALSDSQATSAICLPGHAEILEQICRENSVRLVHFREDESTPAAPLPVVSEDRGAMILYTSGTTNKPKGVVTTHANIRAQIATLVEAWEWHESDRIPLFLPMHHIHGIINVTCCALWSGALIEAFPRFDAATVLERVAAGAYTLFMAVPTIYVKLIESFEAGAFDSDLEARILAGFAAMRLMISGSAALPPTVHKKWTALTGQNLLERYGMTEIAMAISNPLRGERRPGAVGLPLPTVEIRLRAEDGSIVNAPGQPGEIQVRGPVVFREYWNRPEATAEAFIDGWFCTGDMAVLENGYYRIMGRLSVDIIKSGGYKLSALEIEATLLEHPSIRECAVVGLNDETWGEMVAVAVALEDGVESMEIAELRQWSRDRLSYYKLPKKLMVVKSLPRNAMGKVTKRVVGELLEASFRTP